MLRRKDNQVRPTSPPTVRRLNTRLVPETSLELLLHQKKLSSCSLDTQPRRRYAPESDPIRDDEAEEGSRAAEREDVASSDPRLLRHLAQTQGLVQSCTRILGCCVAMKGNP
eukprot:1303448-Pleurochrysis_carterae.AAC.3